jgi:hypothetical protein
MLSSEGGMGPITSSLTHTNCAKMLCACPERLHTDVPGLLCFCTLVKWPVVLQPVAPPQLCARWLSRYVTDRRLPDSAVDLMDEAAARAVLRSSSSSSFGHTGPSPAASVISVPQGAHASSKAEAAESHTVPSVWSDGRQSGASSSSSSGTSSSRTSELGRSSRSWTDQHGLEANGAQQICLSDCGKGGSAAVQRVDHGMEAPPPSPGILTGSGWWPEQPRLHNPQTWRAWVQAQV